jgi:TPR repeat protein
LYHKPAAHTQTPKNAAELQSRSSLTCACRRAACAGKLGRRANARDIAKARKAAEAGDAAAMYSLGVMYFKGEGVPKDYKEAAS